MLRVNQERGTSISKTITAMCQANGKFWGNYWQNQATQAFLTELAEIVCSKALGFIAVLPCRPGSTQGNSSSSFFVLCAAGEAAEAL
jgi:hypothetical protein